MRSSHEVARNLLCLASPLRTQAKSSEFPNAGAMNVLARPSKVTILCDQSGKISTQTIVLDIVVTCKLDEVVADNMARVETNLHCNARMALAHLLHTAKKKKLK